MFGSLKSRSCNNELDASDDDFLIDKGTLRLKKKQHISKITMQDVNIDYASKVTRTTPWGSNFTIDGLFISATGNNEFKIHYDMIMLISGSISMIRASGQTSRDSINFWWEKKVGSSWEKISPSHNCNYMRNATGHEQVTQPFSIDSFLFDKNDIIRMRHKQLSGSGGIIRATPDRLSTLTFQRKVF